MYTQNNNIYIYIYINIIEDIGCIYIYIWYIACKGSCLTSVVILQMLQLT